MCPGVSGSGGTEFREGDFRGDVFEDDADGHADGDPIVRETDDVGVKERAFFQLDEGDDVGEVVDEGGDVGLVHFDAAPDDATAAGFDEFSVRGEAPVALEIGREPDVAAGATLGQDELVLFAGVPEGTGFRRDIREGFCVGGFHERIIARVRSGGGRVKGV